MLEQEKLVLVREQDVGCAQTFKFLLQSAGYSVRTVLDSQGFPADLAETPVAVITFWGTTPLGEEHPLYGLSSRAFCSACISREIPFVIVTRWPHAVPEHFAERAAAVLEKVVDIQELCQIISNLSSEADSV
ncbi:MAG: hypothetical protein U9M98_02615 [Patescibacteria group bacterium]|nr:hypothetical protein [Patescibacteria group bacterium]